MKASAQSHLPITEGNFEIMVFPSGNEHYPHVVIYKEPTSFPPIVRIHSECMTGDVFGSQRCDCGEQLKIAKEHIAQNGGAILYLRQEGRGIGLTEKIKAYALQDQGANTIEANLHLGHQEDERNYEVAVQILLGLGWKEIQLMTNNPQKISELELGGIKVVKRISIISESNPHNRKYLETKSSQMGHWLNPKD
jgi:3,4-dihydroxy 2-butanone 4-phosphate synthase/GTP cyclohydrolase II